MARLAFAAAVACIAFASLPSAFAKPETKPRLLAVPGEYLVELKSSAQSSTGSGVSAMSVHTLTQMLGVDVVDRVRDDVVLVHAEQSASPAAMMNLESRLRENPLVALVEPNYLYYVSKTPNDPAFRETWGLKNSGQYDAANQRGVSGIDIGADAAWNITTGSKSVVVAVIDTGIDFGHPDLKSQAWVNLKELNGRPGVDDDGNGLVDDINGYNFADNKGDSTDDHSHGTHCAGTIGAQGDDGRGVSGVNWNVSLMALKFMNKDGEGTAANSIKAIDYARKMGAKVMSNSWGGGGKSALVQKAIEAADRAGILFVAAAGNDGENNDKKPSFPSNYAVPNVLAVAAVDNRGALADFSNYGAKSVHVAAPGVNIYSTVLNKGYEAYSGTSMATPHVAGVAALMLAKNKNLTGRDLKKKIIASARPLYALKKKVSSGGMVNAYSALTGAAVLGDPSNPNLFKNVMPYAFSSDHQYKAEENIERRVQIPGAQKIAVRFKKFDTEVAYDAVSFFDGAGAFQGSLSGKLEKGVTSPIIEGDTVVMKFVSDEQNNAYGFDVEAILSE